MMKINSKFMHARRIDSLSSHVCLHIILNVVNMKNEDHGEDEAMSGIKWYKRSSSVNCHTEQRDTSYIFVTLQWIVSSFVLLAAGKVQLKRYRRELSSTHLKTNIINFAIYLYSVCIVVQRDWIASRKQSKTYLMIQLLLYTHTHDDAKNKMHSSTPTLTCWISHLSQIFASEMWEARREKRNR